MRCMALQVSVACITAVQLGIAQGRVAGRGTLLEKGGKSSPDLGAAVVYLDGGAADGAARPVTLDLAINDKEVVPRVVVVPAGLTVPFPTAGAWGIELQLDARGFRWMPHKNKYGKDYPTNAGRERY